MICERELGNILHVIYISASSIFIFFRLFRTSYFTLSLYPRATHKAVHNRVRNSITIARVEHFTENSSRDIVACHGQLLPNLDHRYPTRLRVFLADKSLLMEYPMLWCGAYFASQASPLIYLLTRLVSVIGSE